MSLRELDYLFIIQTQKPPCLITLPNYQNLCKINLSTRLIENFEINSTIVEKDHLANVIYFRVDRYLDYMDLSTTSCVIQYQTPDGQTHIYPIPYYDIHTLADCNEMIIPWNIDSIVTGAPGTVSYSVRFFKVDGDIIDNAKIVYDLNTLTSSFTVNNSLSEIEIKELESDESKKAATELELLIKQVKQLRDDSFSWRVIKKSY